MGDSLFVLVNDTHPEVTKARDAGIRPHLYIVACGKAKLDCAAPAAHLYTGDLTAKQIAWVSTRRGTFGGSAMTLIASAAHGLVDFDQVLAPYDVTLNDASPAELAEWAALVARQAAERGILDARVTVYGGRRYAAAITKAFAQVANPDTPQGTFRTRSLELGERKAALKKLLDYTAAYTPA